MVRHCLWKMCAIPSACIKPGLVGLPLCYKVNLLSYVARQPLSGHRVNLSSCVAERPLCQKVNLPSCVARQLLCHKVNLLRSEVRRRHLIMTCDIFGTRQTNTLTLRYLLGKTSPQWRHSRVTEINTLDQITGKVIDVSRTHIPLKALTGLVRNLNSDVKAFKKVNSVEFILSTS